MQFFEQSFGKADTLQKTAQFFNPDNCKIKQNFLKRRRENSLPQQNLEAIKAIIQKTKMLQKNMISRKNTFHKEKENLQTLQSTKQSTKQSTQQSEDNTPNLMDIHMKHSTSSQIVHHNLSFNSRKFPLITEYSSNNTNQIENNSRLSKASNSQERKRTIKVKDPYGIFKPVAVPRKYSSKSFINQKAQIKLVDRIFSSRSDSLQA